MANNDEELSKVSRVWLGQIKRGCKFKFIYLSVYFMWSISVH